MTVYMKSLANEETTLSEIFEAYPGVAIPMLEACENIMRGPSNLPVIVRETLAAFVSSLNGCPHCTSVHTSTAESLGVPQGQIAAMKADLSSADIDAKLRPIFEYARKMTVSPTTLQQSDADAVYAAGWDETALHDIAAVCALFQFFNFYVMGTGLPDNPLSNTRGKAIGTYGYAIMIEKLNLREKHSQT